MAAALIVIESGDMSIAGMRQMLDKSHNRRRMLGEFIAYLKAIMGGFKPAYMHVELCDVFATAYYTCVEDDAVDGTDVATIAGVALSVEAEPANESEFLKGTTNAAFATNLAACINAHSTLSKICRAYVSNTNRCNVVSKVPGIIGNLITLAETGNGLTASAAALATGAGDETDSFQMGFLPTGVT